MDKGEELLYIRAGGKSQFSTEKCVIWNYHFPPERIEIYAILYVFTEFVLQSKN